jgi:hypothetical protein
MDAISSGHDGETSPQSQRTVTSTSSSIIKMENQRSNTKRGNSFDADCYKEIVAMVIKKARVERDILSSAVTARIPRVPGTSHRSPRCILQFKY